MFDDLLDACRRNDLEQVQALVAADPTLLTRHAVTGETAFLTALYHRSREVGMWLATQSWLRTAFEAAAANDAARLRDILAMNRDAADTYSVDGWTPLHLAAFFGSADVAELLLTHGADHRRIARNSVANTPLHAALAARHLPLVQLLLDHGADPAISCAGYTPLELAQAGGFDAGALLIRTAIDRGAAS